MLEERGWKELELLTEDLHFYAGKQVESTLDPECEPVEESPEVQVERLYGGGPGFFSMFWDSIRGSPILTTVAVILLVWGTYKGRFFLGSIGAVILLIFPTFYAVFSLPGRYYALIQKAKVWEQWDEVEKLLERLTRVQKLTRLGVGEVEMVRTRAMALAHKGKVEEAVELYEKLKGEPNFPDWLFYTHLGSVYDSGKKHEAALQVRERAVELEPENGPCWIDVAFSSVRWLKLPQKGRAALKRAEECEISDFGRKYLPFVYGMIHWREQDSENAKKLFEEALVGFKKVEGSTPLVEGLLLLSKSYLCAAHRALGDDREANRYWKQVKGFLVATKELLAACRPHGEMVKM